MSNIQLTSEIEEKCCVARGIKGSPAPIPQEGLWTKCKEIKDINGLTHGCGCCAPQQGTCKLTLNVKEGIIAAKIAAHAADIAKGIPGAKEWDKKMSQARKELDWEKMFSLAIDPEKARRYREEAKPEKEDTCSMCGNFCAVKNMNRILDGEIVSIYDE